MKKIATVPALLTLGNGICGFAAIAWASRIENRAFDENFYPDYFATAGWLILIAMVFDMLDGYVARLSRTASKFGGELDSLCDAVSFGVAPAFLLLKMGQQMGQQPLMHQLLAGIAAIYMSCALLRLARFNVDNTPDPASHRRFKGLPSPAAAGCLAALAVFRGRFPSELVQYWPGIDAQHAQDVVRHIVENASLFVALVVALLMVSRVPYPHVTKQMFRGRRPVGHLIQLLLAALIILLLKEVALILVFWGYALGIPLMDLLTKKSKAPETQAQVNPQG